MKTKKIFKITSELGISVAVVALAVAGCGGGGSTSGGNTTGGNTTSHPLYIWSWTSQGTTANKSLDGTWVSCHGTVREELVASNRSILMHTYNTAGVIAGVGGAAPTCPAVGAALAANEVVVTSSSPNRINIAFVGWLDPAIGTGSLATAPPGLTGNPAIGTGFITVLPMTGTYGGAALPAGFSASYWVDDRSTIQALYRGKSGGVCPVTASSEEPCLSTADPYYK